MRETQPDLFQLIDTGKPFPERFAMRALRKCDVTDAEHDLRLMSALNGAMPDAKIVRDEP